MRLQGEHVYQGRAAAGEYIFNVVMPNMFAGSILDLEPGTEYEARFVLTDPDGVVGKATRLVTVKTRPDPKPAEGGHVYHVYPVDWKGPKEPNSFTGLNCAYNYYCGGGDTSLTGRPRVKAGDIILVHAGVYKSLHDRYGRDSLTRPVEGTYYFFGNGTPEKPIVIKAAGDGEVIFDGLGNFTLFNLQKADYNYFEGITFRNTDIAIQAGTQFIAGSKGLTVKHCRFENVNIGINTSYSGSQRLHHHRQYLYRPRRSRNISRGGLATSGCSSTGSKGRSFPHRWCRTPRCGCMAAVMWSLTTTSPISMTASTWKPTAIRMVLTQ